MTSQIGRIQTQSTDVCYVKKVSNYGWNI